MVYHGLLQFCPLLGIFIISAMKESFSEWFALLWAELRSSALELGALKLVVLQPHVKLAAHRRMKTRKAAEGMGVLLGRAT